MNTTWKRSGSGLAHIVVSAGDNWQVTACHVSLPRTADTVTTRWVEGERGHFYTRPTAGDACPHCERIAQLAEM